jgi:hypothetical protein
MNCSWFRQRNWIIGCYESRHAHIPNSGFLIRWAYIVAGLQNTVDEKAESLPDQKIVANPDSAAIVCYRAGSGG